jgi:HPt (histidine-containing phosphotransfer) domain-containing protein
VEVALDDAGLARLTDEIGGDGVTELVTMFAEETLGRLQLIADPGLDRGRRLLEVHSLKGAAASVCAVSLSRRAASLEMHLKHDDTIECVDTSPLVEAFDAWREAVRITGATETIAA